MIGTIPNIDALPYMDTLPSMSKGVSDSYKPTSGLPPKPKGGCPERIDGYPPW